MINYSKKKTLKDVVVENKTVIVRLDLNVPFDKDGNVTDFTRINGSLPTLHYLLDKKAKVIALSHVGKVKTKEDLVSPKKTLKNVAKIIAGHFPQAEVIFEKDNTSNDLSEKITKMAPGSIMILENTRFADLDKNGNLVKRESKNDSELGKFWASLADVFVNDAFGTCHRKHASNAGIASHISESCIGFLVEKELSSLLKIETASKPLLSIMGGAKISDKLKIVEKLLEISDKMVISGGMAYTFLKAQGYEIGKSLVEDDMIENCKKLLADPKNKDKIVLPVDFVCNKEFKDEPGTVFDLNNFDQDYMSLDDGPKSIESIIGVINKCNTIFWNGPCGVFEFKNYCIGTKNICEAIAKRTESGCYTVIGGGDSASAANKFAQPNDFSFISTGGGASLTYVSNDTMPGVDCIQDK